MIPSKSKKSESRRSSILKPRKPRQPLQNVNFDSSSNENSPAASKVKRRVSFAEKKHVKEFCHSTEQGTVWDNTYEEHDSNLKGSFVVDQNAEVESKENASCASNNDHIHIHSESNSHYPNNAYLVNNRLSQESVARANEEDDTNCDIDFTNPVKSTESSNVSQLGYAALPNKSHVSINAVSNGIAAYSDTDEDCLELSDEKSQPRQTVITNISHASKNLKSSNITIYRDSDEEDYANNIANIYYFKSCSNNVNSELDKTRVQDLSMESTTPIPAFLSSSYLHAKEQKEQTRNDINNLDTNYTTNCSNISMEITEAVPIFAKSVTSDLEISKQIPTILSNCENTKWDANTHNTTDVNYANDSMMLTSVIQPFTDVTDTGICRANNTAFDTSMEIISIPSKMYGQNACNENIVKGNDLRKSQTDKTEIFNDILMELTKPINTILFPNYNKENSRMDEPISKDRTMFLDNISMEMTKTVSTKGKQEIADANICKSLSEENAHDEKDVNISVYVNEGTRILCKSMEFTETVSTPLHYERMSRAAHVAQSVNKSTWENYKNDRTECFNDASMEITKSVNMLPLNIDKENLNIDESISKDDKTMLFHNVSMEMTTAMSSRNGNKITQPMTCKSISKENTYGEKDTNNSHCFNEGTKLLCKSMEFTEVVPVSLHDERRSNTIHTTQSTFSQTLSKTVSLPAENSVRMAFQNDAVANKTIQDISMETTAAVPSTLQLMQDVKLNKAENFIISKNDEFQHLTTNNNLVIKSNESTTKENFTISREIVEIENIRYNELSNVIIQPLLDNLDHSLNANFGNVNGKKRMSDASERMYPKRTRSSFMEVQSSQKNDIHSLPSANSNYINDVECNECFAKDIIDHTQVSDSNPRDSLNEISEHSSLRKSLSYLENSFVELQSIKPQSFCLESEEEHSFHEIQHKLQSSITDIPVNNASNRLITNDVTESKCLTEELINIENNQAEDCHTSTIVNKTKDNQETNCQTITKTKTIINDNQSNKSNYTIKNINEESISSINAKNEKVLKVLVQDINHCTSLIIKEIEVTDKDQVDEREHTRKRLNEDAKLQNDIKEREQYSDKQRQETEKCSDHLKSTRAVIEDQIDSEERRKNLNDNVKQQSMEQTDEYSTKRLVTAQHISTIENVKNESLIEQDPFLTLSQKLETHAAREDCIWNIYYKNIYKKMIVFDFISNSLLIATFLSCDFNDSGENLIKEIKIISRISDDAGVLIRIVHKLILEKINAEILKKLYRTHQDILPMLNFISQDVKLAMDFMFDLRRLDDLNLMEIVHDEISFVSRSKRMDIILSVTIKVKQFDKLTPNDISLHCLLGRIKETDIKNLIKNVKRDHKFLRRYMNDVKDYIDIIEETFK